VSGRRIDPLEVLGAGGAYIFIACLYVSPADLLPWTAPLRPAMLSAAAMVSAVLLRRIMRGEPVRAAGGTGAAVAVLFALLLLSPLWSLDPRGSLGYALGALKLAAAFVGLAGTLRTPAQVRRALVVAALSSAVPAAVTLQHWHDEVGLVEGYRATYMGLLANPNQLAAAMAMTVPLALAARTGSGPVLRALLLVAAGLDAAAMVATHSRGGLLGFAAGLAAWALLSRQRMRSVALAAAGSAALAVFAPSSFWERTRTIGDYAQDASAQGRLQAWETGAKALAQSPLLGVGAGAYLHAWDVYAPRNPGERAYASHNMWAQVAVELGLLGAACFAAVLLLSVRALWRARTGPAGDDARALCASLAALVVCGQTAGNAFHWFTYLALGLAAATAHQRFQAAREAHGAGLAAA